MRVLHWNEGWLPLIGGTEVLLHDVTQAQRRAGHEVAVICDRPLEELPATETVNDVVVHRLRLCSALRAGSAEAIRHAANEVMAIRRTFRPDIVHLHLNGPSLWFHLLTAATYPAPVIITLHTPFRNLVLPEILRDRLLAQADWISAVSRPLLADLHRLAPQTQSRSSVVWNALAVPAVQPAPLPFDPPVLLAAGRLVAEKGFDTAFTAMAELRTTFPDLRLIVAGEGPERAGLERLAADTGIADAVSFPGWVEPERIPALINDATALLMPSRWDEPFGLIALQAAQMARPVVATRVGGLSDVVEHERTGFLVDPEDPQALAAAATELLRDRERASQMGEDARQRVRDRFSLESCTAAYDELYRLVRR